MKVLTAVPILGFLVDADWRGDKFDLELYFICTEKMTAGDRKQIIGILIGTDVECELNSGRIRAVWVV